MKKTLILFVASFFFASCSNIQNKSVTEKLSIEDLAKEIKKEPLFGYLYEMIRANIDRMNESEKAKYYEITYHRFNNYLNFRQLFQDSVYVSNLEVKYDSEWMKEFGIYEEKANSVIDSWREKIKENSLKTNDYVKIDLIGIEKNVETMGGTREPFFVFKITSLIGHISKLEFRYYNKRKNFNQESPIETCWGYASDIINIRNKTSIVCHDREIIASYEFEDFLKNYDIFVENIEIKNGDRDWGIYEGIPESIKDYLKNEYDGSYYMLDVYRSKIINEFVSVNYKVPYKGKYVRDKIDELIAEKDRLCYDLFNKIFDKNWPIII